MKNNNLIFNYQIFSFIFVSILGTLLHFTYEWSDSNQFVGLFSAVNESTWEHLKLIFFPTFLTIIIGYFYFTPNVSNFICAKTIGLFTSLLFTIIFFYTYTGILGTNIDFINILTFFMAVLLGEYVSYKLISKNFMCNNKISVLLLATLFFSFLIFTFNPPQIGLFNPPIT